MELLRTLKNRHPRVNEDAPKGRPFRFAVQVQLGVAMILKCVALVFTALALAGCCISGTTCEAPATGSQIANDGLGPAPNDYDRPPKAARPAKTTARPVGDAPGERWAKTKDDWEQQQAADKADEARLSRKMQICRGCSTQSSESEGSGGIAR
jgi:hypothetical protein